MLLCEEERKDNPAQSWLALTFQVLYIYLLHVQSIFCCYYHEHCRVNAAASEQAVWSHVPRSHHTLNVVETQNISKSSCPLKFQLYSREQHLCGLGEFSGFLLIRVRLNMWLATESHHMKS